VNFDATGKTVRQINAGLLDRRVFGGKDLSGEFPRFGQSALYCISEIHAVEDLKRLVQALKEVIA
jgi:glycine dehydrogenase subunit 1